MAVRAFVTAAVPVAAAAVPVRAAADSVTAAAAPVTVRVAAIASGAGVPVITQLRPSSETAMLSPLGRIGMTVHCVTACGSTPELGKTMGSIAVPMVTTSSPPSRPRAPARMGAGWTMAIVTAALLLPLSLATVTV